MSKSKDGGSTAEALAAALVEDPDDVAAHRAYADCLQEQGDPRGEFIHVQLALESPQLSAEERLRLEQREKVLLEGHARDWLGELAEPFLERGDVQFRFARGWLDSVQVGRLRDDLSSLLATAPQLRLLRRFVVADNGEDALPMDREEAARTQVLVGTVIYEPDEEAALLPFLESNPFGNLRMLQLGDADYGPCDVGDEPIPQLLEGMPRLEELRLFPYSLDAERTFALKLPRLRLLQVCGVYIYPLEVLAANDSLGGLTHLLLDPAAPGGHQKIFAQDAAALLRSEHLSSLAHLRLRFLAGGDQLCREVVDSGILRRLRTLDLQFCEITDEGAQALAESPDLPRLESLDVSWNYLSEDGLARLRAAGARLADGPQTSPPSDPDEDE